MRLDRSYYAATAAASPATVALAGETSADVCVIGGGFTGLSAALSAAEAGFSVVLLEAEYIGFGASGRNGGQLIPGLRWSMQDICREFGAARGRAIYDVAMAAVDSVETRVTRHGIQCDLKPGHLEAAYKPGHFDDMCRDADFLTNEFGREGLDIVPKAAMGEHIGTESYHGGIYDRRGGHFHPLNYALGLADAARAAGVRIFERSRVTSIDDGVAVTVRTAAGSVRAEQAIVATDAWTGDIVPALGRFTVPVMNYNIATAPLGDLACTLLPSNAAVADSRFVLNYFRLSADGRMIFGGGEKYRQQPPRDIAAFVRPHMAKVFPALAAVPVDYSWGGAVSVTISRLPHLGRRGNCWFAHGFSGHGALLTTLAGELVVEAMRGTVERFDVLAGLPHRAFPGGRLLQSPLATLGLMWFALRDRL